MKKVEYRKILIVEDSVELSERLYKRFSQSNKVFLAKSLFEATEILAKTELDIILLDLILPDGSGLQIFEHMTDYVPVVILSVLGTEENVICGFDHGATDYIVKPASEDLIETRMAMRLLPPQDAVVESCGLTLDSDRRTARYKGTSLDLTSSEFNVLYFLMKNAGVFFTANDVYTAVWQLPHLNTSTIKMHIHNMRKKMMNVSPDCAALIVNRFGLGYAFCKGDPK